MKEMFSVLAVLILFIGPTISEDALFATKQSILFGYTDSTNGNGSFSSYDELSNLVKKTCYGSGTIANRMMMGSNQALYIYQNLSENYYNISSAFAVLASHNMVYKPRSMTIGTGYYAANPLYFNISLGDKFQIKNYAAETSMAKNTQYVTAINGTLIAGSTTKYSNKGYNFASGRIALNLAEAVINGSSNLRMVHSDTHDKLDVDQVYTGTFNLKTNMSLSWPVVSLVSEDSWLPCCYGGWENMSTLDNEGFGMDAKMIFDCTCHNGGVIKAI
jgi:hypothetical protein